MKKAFIIAPILSAALILSACGAQKAIKPAEEVTPAQVTMPTASSSPSAASTPSVASEPSATVDADSFGVPKEINGYALFADIALLSDPPEDGIDMFEAVRQLSLNEDPITIMSSSDKNEFAYRYGGIVDIEGEVNECYDIFLLMKDINGEFSEGTDIGRYAVSTGGRMYVFLEESGEYVRMD